MSIRVSLSMVVSEGKTDALNRFLAENLANVRGFTGARSVEIFFNAETRRMMIFEEWQSRDHHQAYIGCITENGVLDALLAHMEGAPEVQYFEKLPL